MGKRIVLAGGGGFIGSALAKEFLSRNFEVIVLTRSPEIRGDGAKEIFWDAKTSGDWATFLDGAEAIVNLTGKNINCPHTPENVRELTESRVESVNAIALALRQISKPPRVWIQAGAIGFYGDQKEKWRDENSSAGDGALAEICKQWEQAFHAAKILATRKVLLRIGFVLGRDGGALPVLAKLTKCFFGGSAGGGGQFVSWIHLADLCRMFFAAVEREELSGTFNAVAPNPVTNKNFMRELRRALHRPWSPPAPEFAVKLGARLMKSEPSLALAGCRVASKKFLENGFGFQFSELRGALENLYK